jgi:hypothetical protein
MAKTAVTELQQQIEVVRLEAFATGYAAAMQAIRELASRPAPGTGGTTSRRQSAAGRRTSSTTPRTTTTPTRRRRARASERAARPRRSAARRPQRGTNAERIEQVLKASAPCALRMAEIRKALHGEGIEMAFTSIRHALTQLERRNTTEQVGDKTWRQRGV